MSTATRTTRRAQLNNIESLLLAQAVWEHGAAQTSWPAVAKILSKHPLLSRPKSFFTAQVSIVSFNLSFNSSNQSCHAMYENLMKEADLEMYVLFLSVLCICLIVPSDMKTASRPMVCSITFNHYLLDSYQW
jgi:hypothetical protein